jgi:predicted acylesterase/phospholipase RssA
MSRARAQDLWPADGTAPVVFSFSGGISLGSYQAGVNWALLEFIKRTHYDTAYRREQHLPDISVEVMTGASAGSINVLLGATQYCDRTGRDLNTESMLWQTWVVESGWDNLFPEGDRGPDAGVLDRSRLRSNLLRALRDRMNDTTRFDPACDVPIGVVATRVRAGTIAYDKNIVMPNQRFVGLIEARTLGSRLRFVRARPHLLRGRELGAQLILPSDDNGVIALERVFALIEASASYPVAFSPVRIQYQEPTCILYAPTPPGCTEDQDERFMDGGVFDNNPVSLAISIQQRLRNPSDGKADTIARVSPRSSKQRVLYVDPDAARGLLKLDQELRLARASEPVPDGVGALFRFASGFVPSARSYELQSFTRSQSSLSPRDQASIRSSTRAHVVVGEHFGAFAAFFGRPFREFDFYVGVADAMQFIASDILCDGTRLRLGDAIGDTAERFVLPASGVNPAQQVQGIKDQCVERETRNLALRAFSIDPVGRYILQRVLAREFPALWPTAMKTSPAEQGRLIVLAAIEEATHAKVVNRFPYDCRHGIWVVRVMCADGFDRVLEHLGNNKSAVELLRCRHERGAACDDGSGKPFYPSSVELTYDLVSDRRRTLDRIMTAAFRQMRDTERKQVPRGRPTAVKMTELVLRSTEPHDSRRVDGGPTSIPRGDGLWGLLAYAPYYVGLSIGSQGIQFGWQPSVHLGWYNKGIVLHAPIEVARLPRQLDVQQGNAFGVSVSPSVGFDLQSPVMNQVSMGLRLTQEGRWTPLRSAKVRQPALEVSSYWLFRKVRAAAYLVPAKSINSPDGGRWLATLSIADINGALYWMLR